MPILTKRFGASAFQETFTLRSIEFLRLASASGISFSRLTSAAFCGVGGSEGGVLLSVSALHDRYSHARNYIGLPSNTALSLSTGNRYLFLLQRQLIPFDS